MINNPNTMVSACFPYSKPYSWIARVYCWLEEVLPIAELALRTLLFIVVPPVICCFLELLFAFWDRIEGREYRVTADVLDHALSPEKRDEGGGRA